MFEHVKISGDPKPVPEAEVDGLETHLETGFPVGYREFVTRFGRGVLGDTYLILTGAALDAELANEEEEVGCDIRVYLPEEIRDAVDGLDGWRERIEKYWFWDAGADVLSKKRALECIIIGDTTVGDELIFHPSNPDRIYILPRDEDGVYAVDEGLTGAIEWLFGSGELYASFKDRCFKAL